MPPRHFPLLLDITRLSVWLMVLAVVFVPLERLFAVQPHAIWRKGMVTDLCYYFLNGLLPAFVLSFPIAFLAWSAQRVVPEGVLAATASMPLWGRVLTGLAVGEVGYYWSHRLSHEIPFLWRFHSIHHSAEEMDFLVNTRAHPADMVFGRLCGLAPLYMLGLGGPTNLGGSAAPLLVSLIGVGWGFFIHANVRWRFGPLEWLVSTPGFHHWHHTRSGPINRNYASTFAWVDWVFGTMHLPRQWPSDYGSTTSVPDELVDQIVFPFFKDEPTRPDEDPGPEAGPTPLEAEGQLGGY